MHYLGTALEVKAVDSSQRIITAYAAVAGNLDRVGDIIDPGAFTKCLAEKGPTKVRVFIAHKTTRTPVGVCQAWKFDGRGLLTETKVFRGPSGDDLLGAAEGLLSVGETLGASIGYRTRDSKLERVNGKTIRRLMDIDVLEYSFADHSLVANPDAVVVGVKAVGEYRVEQRPDGWHVLEDADGDDLGTYDSEAEAATAVRGLEQEAAEADDAMPAKQPMKKPMAGGKTAEAVKAVWSTAQVNDLPNSSFLFVEPGEDDDEGKRVPRSKRHFPYKDAEGKIDLPHLRDAIGRIPQSNASGLNKDALQARAQRLLADAQSGGKLTGDESDLQPGSAPLALWVLGMQLQALADDLSAQHKAMSFLGEDHKAHAIITPPKVVTLREMMVQLQNVLDNAAAAEAGTADQARLARARRQFALLAV